MNSKRMVQATRWLITLIILIAVWSGNKWALYLAVTIITVSQEIVVMRLYALEKMHGREAGK